MIKRKFFNKISQNAFKGIDALEEHISVELIEETCIIELEGAPPLFYLQEKFHGLEIIPQVINQITLNASTRSSNKGEKSILFGAVNKLIGKFGACTQGALFSKSPELDLQLCSIFAEVFDGLLKEYLPQRHMLGSIKLSQQTILPEYRMGSTNFTSGIINRNSPFKYHLDSFNMMNTYSSMLVFKQNVSGGYLVLPVYGIGFKLDNQAIIQFYGKGILHGVTPIEKHTIEAYRISVVYYATEDLHQCLPYQEELFRIQNKL